MTDARPVAGQTLGRALLAPRSLALLALSLVLATVFATLVHWQVSRAIEQGTVVARPTETVLPLARVAAPATQQTDRSVGQRVRVTGRLLPADTLIAGDRLNRDDRGWWVLGHAVVDDGGASLAVALGWAPTREAAQAAADRLRAATPATATLTGRYVDSDPAEPTTAGSPTALEAVSTARLVNLWTADADLPTYEGVLTLASAPAGLTDIWSPPPGAGVEPNLLNLLYAAEWSLFAVSVFYVLWYRLVRDRWEQEQQALAEQQEQQPQERAAV